MATTTTTAEMAQAADDKRGINGQDLKREHEKQVSDATATTTEYAPNTTNTTLNVKSNSESPTVPTATTSTTGDKEKASLMHADTPAAKKVPRQKQKKSSLFSHLIHVLLPCIGPSKAFDIENGEQHASKAAKPPTNPVTTTETPKPSPVKDTVEGSSTPAKRPEPIDTTMAAGFVPVVPSQDTPTRTVPTTPSDPAVIVPPTPPSHVLPKDETGGVTSGAVQPPGSTGDESRRSSRHGTESGEEEEGDEGVGVLPPGVHEDLTDEDDEEERLIREGGAGIPIGPDGKPCPLLPSLHPDHKGRKCLVLDMDETLLHSSFKLIPQADYVIPVEIEHQYHNVYVIKRPGVDQFLQKMGELYEVVVFTASLSKYADPVLDKLDITRSVSYRLFRESCYNHKGNYVKDLSRLGRPIDQTIILDNSPASYIFHPKNAVPVSSWFNDPHDTELTDLCPFLNDLRHVDDVRGVLDGSA